jgi:hypothetical protein
MLCGFHQANVRGGTTEGLVGNLAIFAWVVVELAIGPRVSQTTSRYRTAFARAFYEVVTMKMKTMLPDKGR